VNPQGRPARELRDEELEHQGTQAHATRNWVFLHGTAAQFANHTARMMELEQEYLRRYPQRTWQGSGGAPSKPVDALDELKAALAGIVVQLQALSEHPLTVIPHDKFGAGQNPVETLLARLAASPGGTMDKLELHQAARECGVSRETLASLYDPASPLIVAEKADRVITARGRERATR
jgi:Family of unknown function (DUF6158)